MRSFLDSEDIDVGEAKLSDVAKAAGCSLATASRALNNNATVEQEISRRVREAALTLGYISKNSSRLNATRLAGAVIPTLSHAIYATMVDGLQARLAEKNTGLIISTSMYDLDLELEQTRLLLERGATSIVLVGGRHHPQTIALLEQKRIPYVFTYTSEPIRSAAAVGFDNESAGRMGARFLLDLGHRRLAMIAGVMHDNDRAFGRAEGFVKELVGVGIPRERIAIVEAPYQVGAGAAAMKTLMEVDAAPTAVFCGSDILAVGALKYCSEHAISVPNAVSILGFDNLEIAAITKPQLTTLEVPAKEMGRIAGDYILATPSQRRHLQRSDLAVSLVVRESTGPWRSETDKSAAKSSDIGD
jgi:LacI family transcriptional regulator